MIGMEDPAHKDISLLKSATEFIDILTTMLNVTSTKNPVSQELVLRVP